jgi:class 3 adenylate cyclase
VPSEPVERRLAALLSADAVGYSRLVGADEEATVRTLRAHLRRIEQLIETFRGRVVDSPGDNVLAEFASAVGSVRCAVEIQRALAEANAPLPEDRRLLFRIGIHLGEVMVEASKIYGDGVNVAARLEGLAAPGSICLSDLVYRCAAASSCRSTTSASRRSRTSTARCARGRSGSRPGRRAPRWPALRRPPRSYRPTSRRSRCCPSPT